MENHVKARNTKEEQAELLKLASGARMARQQQAELLN
jgi:hypothetical protein